MNQERALLALQRRLENEVPSVDLLKRLRGYHSLPPDILGWIKAAAKIQDMCRKLVDAADWVEELREPSLALLVKYMKVMDSYREGIKVRIAELLSEIESSSDTSVLPEEGEDCDDDRSPCIPEQEEGESSDQGS